MLAEGATGIAGGLCKQDPLRHMHNKCFWLHPWGPACPEEVWKEVCMRVWFCPCMCVLSGLLCALFSAHPRQIVLQ